MPTDPLSDQESPEAVAVIGAGLAGIACAQTLAASKVPAIVFEKSRSFGGRCATRLWQGNIVDHGAQFFTAQNPDFLAAIQNACADHLLLLESPVLDSNGAPLPSQNRPRYYHRQGNNRMAKALAHGLDVRREHNLERLTPSRNGWELEFAEGHLQRASAVVLTCPGPQAQRLIDSDISTNFAPCLTGFFAYSGEMVGSSAECYARHGDRNGVLAWSACENHKADRIKPGTTVFVVQSGPDFSNEFLEAEYDEWLQRQRAALENAWNLPTEAFVESFGHRWRFARNPTPATTPSLPHGLLLAGDSLVPSRIEDAWLSGRDCARELLKKFPAAQC